MSGHIPRELLSALIDGEIEAVEARTVQEHVDACADCRLAMRELEAVRTLVSGLPRLKAPEDLAAFAVRPVPIASHRRRWIAASVAAAAAAVISLAGLVTPVEESQDPPVDALLARHVGVNVGKQSSGEVLFAVTVGR